ncbi:hypothetical protein FHG87_006012 [Trinorchestia longiramus]|nr:hypothetical protein FHG87_006012 [Trinorchestia longiramus]
MPSFPIISSVDARCPPRLGSGIVHLTSARVAIASTPPQCLVICACAARSLVSIWDSNPHVAFEFSLQVTQELGDLVVGVRKMGKASVTSYGLQYVPPIGSELKFDSTGGAKKVLLTMLGVTEPVQLSLQHPTAVKNKSVTVATLSAASLQYTKLYSELSSPPRAVCGLLLCPGNVQVEVALVPACPEVHSFGLVLPDFPASGDARLDCKSAGNPTTSSAENATASSGGNTTSVKRCAVKEVQSAAADADAATNHLFVVFVSNVSSVLMMNNYVALTEMLRVKSVAAQRRVAAGKQISEGAGDQLPKHAGQRREKSSSGKGVPRLSEGTLAPSSPSCHTKKTKEDVLATKNENFPPRVLSKLAEGTSTKLAISNLKVTANNCIPRVDSSIEVGCAENIAHNHPCSRTAVGSASKLTMLDQIFEKSKLDQRDIMTGSAIPLPSTAEEARLKSSVNGTKDCTAPGSSTAVPKEDNCKHFRSTGEKNACNISKKERAMSKSEKPCGDHRGGNILDENQNIVSCKTESGCQRSYSVDCDNLKRVSTEALHDKLNKNKDHVCDKGDSGCQTLHASSHGAHKKRSCKAQCEKCGRVTELREKKSRDTEARHRKDCPRARISEINKGTGKTVLPIISENEESDQAFKNCVLQKHYQSSIKHTDRSQPGSSEELSIQNCNSKARRNEPLLSSAQLGSTTTVPTGSSEGSLGKSNMTIKSTGLSSNIPDAFPCNSKLPEKHSLETRQNNSGRPTEGSSQSGKSIQVNQKKSEPSKNSNPLKNNFKASQKSSELSRKNRKLPHANSSVRSVKLAKKDEESTSSEPASVDKDSNSSRQPCQHSGRRQPLERPEASDKRSDTDSKVLGLLHDKLCSGVVQQPDNTKHHNKEEYKRRSIKGFNIKVNLPVVRSEVQEVFSLSEQKKISKGADVSNHTGFVEVDQSKQIEHRKNSGLQMDVFHASTCDLSEKKLSKICDNVSSEKSVDSGVLSISDLDMNTKELLSDLETNEEVQTLLSSLQLTEDTFTDDSLSRVLKEMNIPENDLDKMKNKIMRIILLLSPAIRRKKIAGDGTKANSEGTLQKAHIKSEVVETVVKSESIGDVRSSKSSKIKSTAKEGIIKVKKFCENFSEKRKTLGQSLHINNGNPIKKLKTETDKVPNIRVEPLVQSNTLSNLSQDTCIGVTAREQCSDRSSSFTCQTPQVCGKEWYSTNDRPCLFTFEASPSFPENDSSEFVSQGEPLDLSVRSDTLNSDLNKSTPFTCHARNYLDGMRIDGLASSVTIGMSKDLPSFSDTIFEESRRSVLRDENVRESSLPNMLAISKSLECCGEELDDDGKNKNARVFETNRSMELQTSASVVRSSFGEIDPWQKLSKPTILQKETSTQPNWSAEPILCGGLVDHRDLVSKSNEGNILLDELRNGYLSKAIEENAQRNGTNKSLPTNPTDHCETFSLTKLITCMRSLDRKILDQHAALLRNDESVREGLSYLTSLINNRNVEALQPDCPNADNINMYIRRQLEKLHGFEDRSAMTLNCEAMSSEEQGKRSHLLHQSSLMKPVDKEGAAVDVTNCDLETRQRYQTQSFTKASNLNLDHVALQSSLESQNIIAAKNAQDGCVNTSCTIRDSFSVDDERSLPSSRLCIGNNAKPPLPPCGAERVQLLQRISAELQSWPCESLQSVSTRLETIGSSVAENLPNNKCASIFMPSENERQQFQKLLVKLRLLFRPVSCAMEGEGCLLLVRSSALLALLLEEPWTSVLANPNIKVYTYETGTGIQEENLCPRLNCGRLLLLHHTALLDSRFGAMLSSMSRDNHQLHPLHHLVIIAKASLRRCIALALRSRPSNALEHRLLCSLRLNLQMLRQ